MTKRYTSIIMYLAVIFSGLSYGMYAQKYKMAPYYQFRTIGNHIKEFKGYYSEVPKRFLKNNVTNLLNIHSKADIETKRKWLVTFTFGSEELPIALPELQEANVADPDYSDIATLKRIDAYTVKMEFGFRSRVYQFFPTKPNGQAIVYHQGHKGGFLKGKDHIAQFLENGYSVVALSMPLLGGNNQPTVSIKNIGRLKIVHHNNFRFLKPKQGNTIKIFVKPVIVMINHLAKDYKTISMVGISGGGWTTTLAAALDTRIKNSFPVAGSYPIYLRSGIMKEWGDWEQTTPDLYTNVNYLALYVLGSSGKHRQQLQILNKFDLCCFNGIRWHTYKDIVAERVSELDPGKFNVFMDESHRSHAISEIAMNRILKTLGTRTISKLHNIPTGKNKLSRTPATNSTRSIQSMMFGIHTKS